MADTWKWEHVSDSDQDNKRMERQARQPQRNRAAFEADLALDEED